MSTGPGEESAPVELERTDVAQSPAAWGHLEIREKIGQGAFGEVFRAWDTRLEREVALKLLKRRDARSSALDEGRHLARLRHPNVVTVYGAECREDRLGLWMDFVRGRTLGEILRDQGSLGAREAALIGMDLCRALAAVHGAGFVHRDVKARNVMREEGGRIVLMDFGAGTDSSADPQPLRLSLHRRRTSFRPPEPGKERDPESGWSALRRNDPTT